MRRSSLWRSSWSRAVRLLQLQKRTLSHRPGPPWNLLFFGTDDFAVESLKALSSSRFCDEPAVCSLEVVTLPGQVPVRTFSLQNGLRLRPWPPDIVPGQFDVGVVVSFGSLLPENLISKFPLGILNVHPSLLPRWRGPAPIYHTILQGDQVTGVTVMQIRPHRFDVGPILSQETFHIQKKMTSEELGATLALTGAQMLVQTLRTLPEKLQNRREQSVTGATFAPKINRCMSFLQWEDQTSDHIDRLHRAIGGRIPLRTLWNGRTLKLLDFMGRCHGVSPVGGGAVPGSVMFLKESNTLSVRCKDGWVGFGSVLLKKRLTAADFYNGYLHQSLRSPSGSPGSITPHGLFLSRTSSHCQHTHRTRRPS